MRTGVAVYVKALTGVGQTHREHRIPACAMRIEPARPAWRQIMQMAKVDGLCWHSVGRCANRSARGRRTARRPFVALLE